MTEDASSSTLGDFAVQMHGKIRYADTDRQGLFQGNPCVATAETVIVHVDDATGRSRQLSDGAVQCLEALGSSRG